MCSLSESISAPNIKYTVKSLLSCYLYEYNKVFQLWNTLCLHMLMLFCINLVPIMVEIVHNLDLNLKINLDWIRTAAPLEADVLLIRHPIRYNEMRHSSPKFGNFLTPSLLCHALLPEALCTFVTQRQTSLPLLDDVIYEWSQSEKMD